MDAVTGSPGGGAAGDPVLIEFRSMQHDGLPGTRIPATGARSTDNSLRLRPGADPVPPARNPMQGRPGVQILLIDDHPLFREGLCHQLSELAAAVSVFEASDLREGLATARTRPDLQLVLIDLNMPGLAGIDAVTAFRDEFPALPLVVLSASQAPADIRRAIEAGALGFIPKSSRSAVMLGAIRLVLAGGVYLPPQVLEKGRPATPAPGVARPAPAASGADGVALSPRQHEVLMLLVQGKPNKVIARELGVSEGTVKMHLAIIFGTLQARNRTEAVAAARRLGLLPA